MVGTRLARLAASRWQEGACRQEWTGGLLSFHPGLIVQVQVCNSEAGTVTTNELLALAPNCPQSGVSSGCSEGQQGRRAWCEESLTGKSSRQGTSSHSPPLTSW